MTQALVAVMLLASPAPARPQCKGSSKLVGTCFTVHGRLHQGNGTPPFRLAPDGTNRMLGVEDVKGNPDAPWLPKEVKKMVDFEHAADGKFLVCPLSEAREGEMQRVCVESVSNAKQRSN